MTPQHLDLDALADLLAGEGSEQQVAHLSSCAACSGALADLDAASAPVTAALGALSDPAPPADLADRLATALAAAGPVTPAPPVVSGSGSVEREDPPAPVPAPVRSSTVTPLRSRPTAPWLPAAAAAVLLLCAGGLVIGLASRDGSGAQDTASSAAGSAPAQDSTPADSLAGTAFNATGRDYGTPATLEAALPELLAGQGQAARQEVQVDTPGLERLRDPAALADCLRVLLSPQDPTAQPLALDYASYAGAPALLVVLPATDPAKLDAFVVGPACSATNDATLFFARLDRPG